MSVVRLFITVVLSIMICHSTIASAATSELKMLNQEVNKLQTESNRIASEIGKNKVT